MSDEKNAAAEARAARVAALEFEREGYERRGLPERAKQVDAEIAKLKGDVKGRAKPKADEV